MQLFPVCVNVFFYVLVYDIGYWIAY